MDLRQLRLFRQVAESGSISAASSLLRIAQPALSRQVQALEAELGARLFHRTGRGVELTSAGRALLADARRLLDDADGISKRIRAFGKRMSGEATIGLSPTIGRLLTLPLAQHVRENFPELQLRIAEGFSGTLFEWLKIGRIDAAILYREPPAGVIRSEPVATEPLSIISSGKRAPFPAGTALSIAAVTGHPLVLPTPRHGLRQMVDEHASANGVTLDLLFEFDSLDATLAMVRQGKALTILPESAVRSELSTGALQAWRIDHPPLIRPVVIATATQRADAISNSAIAALLRQSVVSAAEEGGWTIR